MKLSQKMVDEFVKAVTTEKPAKKIYTEGVVTQAGASPKVKIGDAGYEGIATPVLSTVNLKVGDKVTVRVENHKAIVDGNVTNPSAGQKEVNDISLEVSALSSALSSKADKNALIQEINESPETIKINGDRVNIDLSGKVDKAKVIEQINATSETIKIKKEHLEGTFDSDHIIETINNSPETIKISKDRIEGGGGGVDSLEDGDWEYIDPKDVTLDGNVPSYPDKHGIKIGVKEHYVQSPNYYQHDDVLSVMGAATYGVRKNNKVEPMLVYGGINVGMSYRFGSPGAHLVTTYFTVSEITKDDEDNDIRIVVLWPSDTSDWPWHLYRTHIWAVSKTGFTIKIDAHDDNPPISYWTDTHTAEKHGEFYIVDIKPSQWGHPHQWGFVDIPWPWNYVVIEPPETDKDYNLIYTRIFEDYEYIVEYGCDYGIFSFAQGYGVNAPSVGSHAIGFYTEATGKYSYSQGWRTIASHDYQTAIGKFNEDKDTALSIGNGTDIKNRHDAVTVDWDGTTTVNGTTNQNGVVNRKGRECIHNASAGRENDGYLKIADITIGQHNADSTISLQLSSRSKAIVNVEILFENTDTYESVPIGVQSFFTWWVGEREDGIDVILLDNGVSAEGQKYGLLVKKSDAYDNISVIDYRQSSYIDSVKMEWTDVYMAAYDESSAIKAKRKQVGEGGITIGSCFSGVDTSNLITSFMSSTSGVEYTATQDCYIEFETIGDNGSSLLYIDGVIIGATYSNSVVSTRYPIPFKKGQTLKAISRKGWERPVNIYGVLNTPHVFNGIKNYSEEEQVIGRWTDGKVLYERVFHTDGIQTINVGYAMNVKSMYGTCFYQDQYVQVARADGTYNSVTSSYVTTDHTIVTYVRGNIDASQIRDFTLIVQYTKPEDSAVPAMSPDLHKYSTEEHVVGQWIDGSVIYEKTIYLNTLGPGENTVNHGVLGFNRIISYSGTFDRLGDGTNFVIPVIHYNPSNWNISCYNFNETSLVVFVGAMYSGVFAISNMTLTIQYTKQ